MKLSLSLLIGFTFSILLGMCPMQISMMAPANSDMAMVHNSDMNMADMEDSRSGTGCSDCENSVDHFVLKESFSPINTAIGLLPTSIHTTIVFAPLLEEIVPIANIGPPTLAPDIVKHIVFRS